MTTMTITMAVMIAVMIAIISTSMLITVSLILHKDKNDGGSDGL